MLELDSNQWQNLEDAQGNAQSIALLLQDLQTAPPPEDFEQEPWYSLWNRLCNDNTVYTASYAAFPHIIEIANITAQDKKEHIILASSIEIYRHQANAPAIPKFLEKSYKKSLKKALKITKEYFLTIEDEETCQLILAAMAAFKGYPQLGYAITLLEN